MSRSKSRKRPVLQPLLCALLLLQAGLANAFDYRGQVKFRHDRQNLPDDSLLRDFSDDPARNNSLDLRLNLSGSGGAWSWQADYQLFALDGDRVGLARDGPAITTGSAALPDDARRLFDLTHRISDEDERVVAHRLDRLNLGYASASSVIRFGRQAVSWGNGLAYNPVDFFNPFDPAAIDTEYKPGDDMLYAQYLLDSGDDLQAVWVVRRDDDDDVSRRASSIAFKYHGFAAGGEYDLLVAEHFDAQLVALGGSVDIAEAIWRGDLLLTRSDGERFTSLVLNVSYAWQAWGRNLSASVEYFHNGFGIDDGDYAPGALAAEPELLARIGRGELFTLGENYLAVAATLELNPLWLLTTSLFANLDDHSQLLQIISRHDLEQDLQLLLALNLPRGRDGSEFGGIDSAIPERPLATDGSLFAQLAWYF